MCHSGIVYAYNCTPGGRYEVDFCQSHITLPYRKGENPFVLTNADMPTVQARAARPVVLLLWAGFSGADMPLLAKESTTLGSSAEPRKRILPLRGTWIT